jgi:hypothetical protein
MGCGPCGENRRANGVDVTVEAGRRDNCQPAFLHTRPVYPSSPTPHLPYVTWKPACYSIVQPARIPFSIPLQTQTVPPMNVNSDSDVVRTSQQQVVTVSYWLVPPHTDDRRRYNRSKRANSTSTNIIVALRTCNFFSLLWRRSGNWRKTGPLRQTNSLHSKS